MYNFIAKLNEIWKILVWQIFELIISICFFAIYTISALYIRVFRNNLNLRLVWGSSPLINNAYWSRGMRLAGHSSDTFVFKPYSINSKKDFDKILTDHFKVIPNQIKPYFGFLQGLFKYDVFFISFDGFFIGRNRYLRFFQAQWLHIAKKKIIVLPYGSDSFVYRNIGSISTAHGLMASYQDASRDQDRIEKQVRYWCKRANAVIPGFMAEDGFGRWDALIPSPLMLDLEMWEAKKNYSSANGVTREVVICHAPNHRGFKGTEFILAAIKDLQEEGLKIKLLLLEGIKNTEVKTILNEKADILVEQIIGLAHGLNGLEGMASGLPTISNLEDEKSLTLYRRWSYFSECPLVSAQPENIKEVLRELITRPALREELGKMGRAYAEKYHGYDSCAYFFEAVIEYVYGKRNNLMDLYHPILGEYNKRLPLIVPPLKKNRI